jgi:hypothetical protein
VDVSKALVDGCLELAQHNFARHHAKCKYEALLKGLDDDTTEGLTKKPRLRSIAGQGASAWLDTLPTAYCLTFYDGFMACPTSYAMHMVCHDSIMEAVRGMLGRGCVASSKEPLFAALHCAALALPRQLVRRTLCTWDGPLPLWRRPQSHANPTLMEPSPRLVPSLPRRPSQMPLLSTPRQPVQP